VQAFCDGLSAEMIDAMLAVTVWCAIGEAAFDQVVRPIEVGGQRASALRFGDACAGIAPRAGVIQLAS
jgi:hypothetical protein